MSKRKPEESPWKPKGSGWRKIPTTKDKLWKMQWKHNATGSVRRDYGEYMEIISASGWRQLSGEGGGILTFQPDGSVDVIWNRTAMLSSKYGTGNRKNRITEAAGKRKPARLDKTYAMVAGIRESFILPHKDNEVAQINSIPEIPGLPVDSDSPEALEILQIFHREAYQILAALVKGDAPTIHAIAAAVENHEKVRNENHDIITEDFQDIEEAIREAAFQAKGIPSRADILNEYTDLGRGGADGITMEAFIDKLARMGFSWLHAPHGKRGKSQKKSGLKEG
jgi:hypothetical protein